MIGVSTKKSQQQSESCRPCVIEQKQELCELMGELHIYLAVCGRRTDMIYWGLATTRLRSFPAMSNQGQGFSLRNSWRGSWIPQCCWSRGTMCVWLGWQLASLVQLAVLKVTWQCFNRLLVYVSIVFTPSQKNEMITPIDKVSFWDVLRQRQLDHFWHNLAQFSRQKGWVRYLEEPVDEFYSNYCAMIRRFSEKLHSSVAPAFVLRYSL